MKKIVRTPEDNHRAQLENEVARLNKKIAKYEALELKQLNYGLVWLDVPEAFENDVENKLPILEEVPKLAINSKDGKPTHLLIEGDNYHALTCLNYTHKGKVDVIYIDPPYNTGSDGFKYKDKRILDKFPDGTDVPKDSPLRHSYWLSFMKKRLELAMDVLSEKGVIFISIDDNELAQLKLICDEVFGEKNFIANFKWNRVSKAPSLSGSVRTKYEYIVAYYKRERIKLFGKSSYNIQGPLWHLPNKHSLLVFSAGSIKIKHTFKKGDYGGTYKVELLDDMIENNGYNKNVVRIKAHSAWGQTKIDNYIEDGFTFEIKKNPTTLYTTLSSEGNYIAPSDLITDKECGVKRNTEASEAIKAMGIPFDYPKPVSLIKYLVNTVTHYKKSAIVLDFFAGSGTTGQAVMEMNEEDKGTRQFVLVTNNDEITNGEKHRIMKDVCYPRIKKVINGYNGNKGLGNSIKYFKTAFVGKNSILKADDRDKIELAHNAGGMLAIAENTFEQVEKTDHWQIFENGKQYTAVYFREEFTKYEEFEKKVKSLKKPVVVYIFSWEKELEFSEFEDEKNITVKTIPQPILEIYKQIYNLV